MLSASLDTNAAEEDERRQMTSARKPNVSGRWVGVLALMGMPWCVEASQTDAWQQICKKTPYRLTKPVPKKVQQALVRAGVGPQRIWAPTVAWVNEQCQALGFSR